MLFRSRLGLPAGLARDKAELLLIAIQGAWTVARAQRNAGLLRSLPARLFGVDEATGRSRQVTKGGT